MKAAHPPIGNHFVPRSGRRSEVGQRLSNPGLERHRSGGISDNRGGFNVWRCGGGDGGDWRGERGAHHGRGGDRRGGGDSRRRDGGSKRRGGHGNGVGVVTCGGGRDGTFLPRGQGRGLQRGRGRSGRGVRVTMDIERPAGLSAQTRGNVAIRGRSLTAVRPSWLSRSNSNSNSEVSVERRGWVKRTHGVAPARLRDARQIRDDSDEKLCFLSTVLLQTIWIVVNDGALFACSALANFVFAYSPKVFVQNRTLSVNE